MAKSKNDNRFRRPEFLFSAFLAVILIFTFVVSLFAPNAGTAVTEHSNADTNLLATSTPTPFVFNTPTVDPNGPQLTYSNPQMHLNGFFQITLPVGYEENRNVYEENIPRARFIATDTARLSVIDVLLQFGVNYPSHQALSDALLVDTFFFDAWSEYDAFEEIRRTVGDTVTIDFNLRALGIDYFGRQITWLVANRLHMVRLVVPQNNQALLEALTENVPPSFIVYADTLGKPVFFRAYADFDQGFMFRHPSWTLVSGGFGSPTVFEDATSPARAVLRSAAGVTLSDLDSAQNYFQSALRASAEILSSQVTTREFGTGYLLSYRDRDSEGNAVSGLAVLLQDTKRLVVLDLRLAEGGLDLLQVTEVDPNYRLREIADSFTLLAPAGLTRPPSERPNTQP
jgi:hypothetical protein